MTLLEIYVLQVPEIGKRIYTVYKNIKKVPLAIKKVSSSWHFGRAFFDLALPARTPTRNKSALLATDQNTKTTLLCGSMYSPSISLSNRNDF